MISLYFKKRQIFLRKIFTAVLLFVITSALYFGLFLLSKKVFGVNWFSNPLFILPFMTLVFILVYKPINRVVKYFFRNVLFKKKSYRHMTLMNLADQLTLILDLKEMGNLMVNTFGEVLHLKSVVLSVINQNLEDDFDVLSAYGWSISDVRQFRLAKNSALLQVIKKNGPHVLVSGQVAHALPWQEANQLAQDFDSLQAGWVIPVWVQGDLIGLLGFSTVRTDKVFDDSDFQFFREFAQQISRPLRNALLVRELMLANETLKDTQSKMLQETKLDAIEQLAAGLAHEIHNPLTIISGKAQVLLLQKDRINIDPKVEDVLKTIVKQTKRAADITRKLLLFSQSSGAVKEMVHLGQLLEDTIALVSYQTELDRIKIARIVDHSIPHIHANVHELREIFLSLILNAVQSVGSDGRVDVELKNRPKDQLVEIIVSDNGKGISEENVDKLFNPFFSTRSDGSGLGLFVARQIIHRYGGSIRADSHEKEGSLFVVELPYTNSSEENVKNNATSTVSSFAEDAGLSKE